MIENFTINKQIDFKKSTVYVIILNIIIFSLATIINNKFLKFVKILDGNFLSFHKDLKFIGLVFVIAIVVGLIAILVINKKFIYKLMGKLISLKIISKLEVWDDFFSTKRDNAHVVIRHMERNIMYYGTVKHYSMATEQQSWALHLVDITVFDMDDTGRKYDIKELYLPFDTKNMTIEFSKK
jgi:hypothetical protein